MPIDLPTALAITTGQNPQVAFAQQRIQESFAKLQAANIQLKEPLKLIFTDKA